MKSFTGAIFKPMLEWFYENESKVYVTFAVSDPGVAAKPWFPERALEKIEIGDTNGNKLGQVQVITINLGPDAVDQFKYWPEGFSVFVRFNGEPCDIYVPYSAVISLHNPNGRKWFADYVAVSLRTTETEVIKTPIQTTKQTKPSKVNFLKLVSKD
jgi:stringent starvation protein B